MFKLLLLSSLIMTVVLPARAARMKNPGRALRRAILSVLAFNIVYWFVVLLVVFIIYKGRDPNAVLTHGMPTQ